MSKFVKNSFIIWRQRQNVLKLFDNRLKKSYFTNVRCYNRIYSLFFHNNQISSSIKPNLRLISNTLLNFGEQSKYNESNLNQNRDPNFIVGHNIEVDGKNIHYETAGNGNHILLLMPGALGTGKNDFLPQLTGLDGSVFKIIAWDPPGYGQSRPPDRDFKDFYHKDAEIAAKLMRQLNYSKYSILGWSDGGITGMILASENSRSIQNLIVWGSNAYVCDEDRELLLKIRDAKNWNKRMRQSLIDIYGEEYFYQLWDRFVSNYLTLNDICKENLKKIECPVLILHGNEDPLVAPEHPVYLVNKIPNATLYRFAKGKHNIHQQFVNEFNQLCEDFLLTK